MFGTLLDCMRSRVYIAGKHSVGSTVLQWQEEDSMHVGLSTSHRALVAGLVVLIVIAALVAVLAFDHQIVRLIVSAGDYVGGS